MKKKLKQVSEGQGFVCATLEEKKRIWKKLTDAGYPMHFDYKDADIKLLCIRFTQGAFKSGSHNYITHPLNESDFFDEWTPQAGEWVEVCDDGKTWFKHDYKFIFEHKGVYYCETSDIPNLLAWKYIRPKPETMTLQEVREAFGKPNLVIE
jgi:hypothetical protein